MFTGLIEMQGTVISAGRHLVIGAKFSETRAGESIAVNGVCLTLLPNELAEQGQLAFDLSPETLSITTLGQLQIGAKVNLERAVMASGARMGGHYVSGHVDTTAIVKSVLHLEDFVEIIVSQFGIPAAAYLVAKGSITLDGISLTINDVSDDQITIMLVPHTLAMTTFRDIRVGQCVNVEFDYLTRIIAHQLSLATSHEQ